MRGLSKKEKRVTQGQSTIIKRLTFTNGGMVKLKSTGLVLRTYKGYIRVESVKKSDNSTNIYNTSLMPRSRSSIK